MPNNKKKVGAKLSLSMLSILLLLLLFANVAFAESFEYQYGDVNKSGEVNVIDVVDIMKHVLNLELLEGEAERLADVDGDSNIDVQDVTLAMQLTLRLIDDIVDALSASGDFQNLVGALEETELDDALKGDGPFTLFAPDDDAFSDLLDALDITVEELLDLDGLEDILLYHVVSGDYRAKDLLKDEPVEIETLQGDVIVFTVENGTAFVNDAEITEANIVAANGVIHVIDTVLVERIAQISSVEAVNRTTIKVVFKENVSEEMIEDKDFYQITVGDEAVEVEEVDYDADENEATLTVDMTGKSGVLIVNGVEAEDEVPALPEFTALSAQEANRDITMHFNVPVYALDDLDPGDDIEVSVAGSSVGSSFEIDIAEDADDAENKVIVTVDSGFRPAANASVVVTLTTSGADKVANVWDEPVGAPQIRSTTATPDNENPTFQSITVYNNTRFVMANFSEPVHTDGNTISVGAGTTQVSVTGVRTDGTPLSFTGDGVNPGLSLDEEMSSLKIELNETVPAGADITVSFGVTAGSRIEDRAGNSLAGTYTRSGTAVAGPSLKNAKASDLSVNASDQTQVFEVTLDDALAEGEEITVDLSDAVAEGVTYSGLSTRYTAKDGVGTVLISGGDTLTFTAGKNLADETTIIITASEAASTGAGQEEDVEIIFTREDIGATAIAKFDILAGLSHLSIDPSYQLIDPRDEDDYNSPIEVLASGQSDHTVEFSFRLQGQLDEGDRVLINVGNMVNAGVTFDSNELTVDHANASVTMVGNVIRVTASGGNIGNLDDVTVTAENVDVDSGSTAEDVGVTFTRNDSGLSAVKAVNIVPSFSSVSASNVAADQDQIIFVSFTLDGARTAAGFFASIDLDHDNNGLTFTDAEVDLVSQGSASVSSGGVVNYFAPVGGLSHGTEVTIQVSGVNASGASDAIAFFSRSGGFRAVDVIEVE